jgi:hypothetical protein
MALVVGGVLLVSGVSGLARDDDPGQTSGRMRIDDDALLWTRIPLDKRDQASGALQKVMEAKGRAGMKELSRDTDLMVALHARWELVKGKPTETGKFVEFFKRNLRVDVPRWWQDLLAGVVVAEGHAHAVPGVKMDRLKANSRLAARGLEVWAKPSTAGFQYEIDVTGLRNKQLVWSGKVWAVGRREGGGLGVHQIEILVSDDRLFVFGAESHGMYAEGFRLDDGKPLLRFCTCYWFNFSERWKLK